MSTVERCPTATPGQSVDDAVVLDTVVIDPVVCSFLADHSVGGTPLLPTALQLDLLATVAGRLVSHSAGVRMRDVRVRDPLRFEGPRTVSAVGRPGPLNDGWQLALASADGTVHLDARVHSLTEPLRDAPAVDAVTLPGTADLVYPPMFHGPCFQVVGSFGRGAGTLVASLARHVRPWDVAGRGGTLPAALLELLLQACGVWELAESAQMMRPSLIGELLVPLPHRSADHRDARVLVRPRPGGDPTTRVFDGAALDPTGKVLLRVSGYQPVELAAAPQPGVRQSLVARIGHHHEPDPTATVPPRGDAR